MKKRTARRARGTGALFWSAARQLWVARLPCGRGPTGYTRYREVTHPTQAGAVERLAKLAPPSDKTTVREFAGRWLESLTVRPQTRTSYANSVRCRIVPSLGHLRIADVTPYQVEAAIRDWTKLGLAVGTVRQTATHARILFGAATRAGLVTANPVSLARKPKPEKREVAAFTADELARIIAAGPPVVALVAACGCRKGEALALDVPDFDAAAGTVRIHKTRVPPAKDQPARLGPPKSPHSVRTVRVPGAALAVVRGVVRGRKTGPLFEGTGGRMTDGEFNGMWTRTLRGLGLPYRPPHTLRHSCATLLIASGVGLADVAAFLGDTPETVAKVYLHKTRTDPAATLDALLGSEFRVSARPAKPRKPLKKRA